MLAVRRLQALRVPTIAAVNGVAAGAGASLAMTCDIAIAAPGASFIQAFSKIGLIPDAGGSWFLVERLGLARALALAMTGDKLPAVQAKEWGMIWDVADDPLAAALVICGHGQLATMAAKESVNRSFESGLSDGVMFERRLFHSLFATADQKEGMDAFLNKRPPAFTHR